MEESNSRHARRITWSALVWLAGPIVMVGIAVYAVYAALGLVADGSFFTLVILKSDHFYFYDPARVIAVTVTQAPVLLASHLGVTDVATLIRIHSASLVGLPIAAWIGALLAQWRRSLYWGFLAMFALVYLNGGLVPIGEYNLAYALVALSAAVLLRSGPLGWLQISTLVFAGAILLRCYEAMVYLGPVLFILAGVRLLGFRALERSHWRVERIALAALLFAYVSAASLSAWAILHPRDPKNAAGASDLLMPIRLDRQYVISLGVVLGCGLVVVLKSALARWGVAIALSGGSLMVLKPDAWAPPWLHYGARTVVGLAFFLALVTMSSFVLIKRAVSTRERNVERANYAVWFAAGTLFVAQAVPFVAQTHGFAEWAADFEGKVTSSSGAILLTDSGLDPAATSRYGWPWTNPLMSSLLQENSTQGVILTPPGSVPSVPEELTDPLPRVDSKFSKTRPLFP